MTRQTHLTLRLARAEATEIEAEAAASGVSVSAYVRQALQDRSRLKHAADAYRQDRQELLQEVGEMLETKLAAIGERHAADLKTIADTLANQVNRGYFIKVTQHLSKQLAAIMAHHKITLPRDET